MKDFLAFFYIYECWLDRVNCLRGLGVMRSGAYFGF